MKVTWLLVSMLLTVLPTSVVARPVIMEYKAWVITYGKDNANQPNAKRVEIGIPGTSWTASASSRRG